MLMVGVWLVTSVVTAEASTSLTSCAISIVTRPPALTLGVTSRMTPVGRYSTLLLVAKSAVARGVASVRVVTGTWLPTSNFAVWLSRTNTCGDEMTLRSVTASRAVRIALTLLSVGVAT
jgi:hypothetical protein